MDNKKDYLNDVKMSKQDKHLYDMAWNDAINAAIKSAVNSIGIETLLATHVSMEMRKLKK